MPGTYGEPGPAYPQLLKQLGFDPEEFKKLHSDEQDDFFNEENRLGQNYDEENMTDEQYQKAMNQMAEAYHMNRTQPQDDNYDDKAAGAENRAEDPRAYTDEGYGEASQELQHPEIAPYSESSAKYQQAALAQYLSGANDNEGGDTSLYEAWKRRAQQNPPQLVAPPINPRFR